MHRRKAATIVVAITVVVVAATAAAAVIAAVALLLFQTQSLLCEHTSGRLCSQYGHSSILHLGAIKFSSSFARIDYNN